MCASIPRNLFLVLWSFKMMNGRPNSSNAKAGVTLMIHATSLILSFFFFQQHVEDHATICRRSFTYSCTAYWWACWSTSDRDKMSESGVEQLAKKAASPLYLGFDFSTQQVRNMIMQIPKFCPSPLWNSTLSPPPRNAQPSLSTITLYCSSLSHSLPHYKPYTHMCS